MTTSRFRHARIAAAGLDVLHMTRLKVACSLLMAERVSAELRDWPVADVDLLVAGMDAPQGIAAAGEAGDAGVVVLRIARAATGVDDTLRHGATVKALFDRLLALLTDGPVQATPLVPLVATPALSAVVDRGLAVSEADMASPVTAWPVSSPPTLLDLAADGVGTTALLERDGLRVAIDRRRGRLYLAHADDLARVAASCTQAGWRVKPMTDGEFERHREALPVLDSLEAFVWRAAAQLDAEVGDAPPVTALTLKGWPILDNTACPAHWLLPLTCLLQGAWSRAGLAEACGLPVGEVARIFAAMHHSGLAQPVDRLAPRAVRRPPVTTGAPSGGFLTRIARRFGMQFGGHRG